MDSFGDHALVCRCHGDRTVRHNRLRNSVYEDAVRGSMGAEKEKQGLLPERPTEDNLSGVQATDDVAVGARGRRRPADVFIARGLGGWPAALDFACTSGLRADTLHSAAQNPEDVLNAYEDFKKGFQAPGESATTADLCKGAGLSFLPMIIESHSGGWGKTARRCLDVIAKHASACWHEDAEVETLRIAQRLSCSLHRENARAIMRRLQEPALLEETDGWSPGELAV